MDKKYISRFLDFFPDFDFNHNFDKQTCFILHILFLHILLVFAHLTCLAHLVCTFLYSITHFTLYFFFLPIYIYALVWCYFYIIFILCTVH